MVALINGLAAGSSILSNNSTSPVSSVMFAVPLSSNFPRSELAFRYRLHCRGFSRPRIINAGASITMNDGATPSGNEVYTVNDFMTRKEQLHILKPTTTIDRALEMMVQYRISGFPVIDDDWNLVGVVSDYDLLALDSISGDGSNEKKLFPEVDRTWKTFNKIQNLLSKNQGRFISEVMTDAPLVVRELSNLEDAARLLLRTKYRRLPVLDASGKLVGMITRGNVVSAALQIKREKEL
ncbi:CBS domain-containing protein CBSX1, chloroplastic [Zostera marina]|uniref:CBS domain-containing protein CBSX1, chloroplastic n=1 Tax=Zostera marina TaxID=29655 RepID=A0A0K9PKD2_ZOSMR|nr:CBS domain-containing protein CBSX1, chloroplastic [Zostera marina]